MMVQRGKKRRRQGYRRRQRAEAKQRRNQRRALLERKNNQLARRFEDAVAGPRLHFFDIETRAAAKVASFAEAYGVTLGPHTRMVGKVRT